SGPRRARRRRGSSRAAPTDMPIRSPARSRPRSPWARAPGRSAQQPSGQGEPRIASARKPPSYRRGLGLDQPARRAPRPEAHPGLADRLSDAAPAAIGKNEQAACLDLRIDAAVVVSARRIRGRPDAARRRRSKPASVREMLLIGRGGQGVLLGSQILADVFARAGYWVQSFPEFKAER